MLLCLAPGFASIFTLILPSLVAEMTWVLSSAPGKSSWYFAFDEFSTTFPFLGIPVLIVPLEVRTADLCNFKLDVDARIALGRFKHVNTLEKPP